MSRWPGRLTAKPISHALAKRLVCAPSRDAMAFWLEYVSEMPQIDNAALANLFALLEEATDEIESLKCHLAERSN